MDTIEKLYNLKEASVICRITRQSLYNHIKEGKLKATKIGKEYRITESNLKQYIEKGHN